MTLWRCWWCSFQERGSQCWLCFLILLVPPSLTEKDSECQEGPWHSGGLHDYLGDSLEDAHLDFHRDSGSATSHFRPRSSLSLPVTHTGHICPSSGPLHPSSPFWICSFIEVWSSHRALNLLTVHNVMSLDVCKHPWPCPHGQGDGCLRAPQSFCVALCAVIFLWLQRLTWDLPTQQIWKRTGRTVT